MSEANNQTTPTLRRAFLFLEDGEWEKADEYCEKTLDAEPENAEAYLVKLLVELRLKSRTMLSETTASLDDNPHFQKIMRFGSDELKKELQEYNNAVKLRLEENRKREQQLQITQTYENAVSLFNSAQTVAECETAANIFRSVSGFADANSYVEKCAEKAEICRKNAIYTTAKAKMAQPSVENYGYAKQLLATISGWGDADALAAECDAGIQRIYEQQRAAQAEEQIRRESAAKRAKKLKTAVIIAAIALVVVAAGVFSFIKFALPAIKYNKALKLIEKEEYANAYDMLEALGDYKDCEKLRKDFIIRFETKIDSEGYVTKYTYDDNANVTKYICRDENGDIVESYEYEYDENG
ncbi:MAG: hypothetical protein IKY12_04215, partial [Clostridia bacterium]|nr:hypothetical protein [Clostridia bacterium]